MPYVLDTTIGAVMTRGDVPKEFQDAVPQVGDVIEEVWISFDGYGKTFDVDDEAVKKVERGDLSKEFAADPNTTVREMLGTFVYTDDLVGGVNVQTCRTFYDVKDGGEMVFDPVERDSLEVQGALHEIVMAYFEGDREVQS